MTMHYRDKTFKKFRIGGGVFILALLIVFHNSISHGIQIGVHHIGSTLWPFHQVLADGVRDNIEKITKSKAQLMRERDELFEHSNQLEIALFSAERIRLENQSLRTSLDMIDENDDFSMHAHVLSLPQRGSHSTMIIDRGARHNVNEGDSVTLAGSILVGNVVRVLPRTAYVQFITDSGIENEIYMPEYEFTAMSTGMGSGMIRFTAPRDIPIVEGDYILDQYTGKVIALVGAILADPRDPVHTIIGHTPIQENRMRSVIIESPLQ